MTKHVGLLVLGLLLVGVLLLSTIAFAVGYDEVALVKRFGRTDRVIDGRGDAGLRFKWPWPIESLVRYDARTHIFEDVTSELNTHDKRNILLTLYCGWRVSEAAVFNREMPTLDSGEARIRDLLRNHKQDMVGRHQLSDFVNTDPNQMGSLDAIIERELLEPVRQQAAQFGVEIVAVGIRSLGLPEAQTQAVIETQIQERQAEAEKYRKQGEADAVAIEARARQGADQILAFAQARARDIRSQGLLEAAQQYAHYQQDPQLAMFLRSLESLPRMLEGRTTIVLDQHLMPSLRLFWQQPGDVDFRAPETQVAPRQVPTPAVPAGSVGQVIDARSE